jgi:hypothetical protein
LKNGRFGEYLTGALAICFCHLVTCVQPPSAGGIHKAGKARLLMELDDHDYANYQAVLQTVEGREILRRQIGKIRFGKDRQFATLPVKAGELTTGDYILILFSQTPNSRNKEIYRYFFRVS